MRIPRFTAAVVLWLTVGWMLPAVCMPVASPGMAAQGGTSLPCCPADRGQARPTGDCCAGSHSIPAAVETAVAPVPLLTVNRADATSDCGTSYMAVRIAAEGAEFYPPPPVLRI